MIHIMNSAELIRVLKAAGWALDRINGAHHVFVKPGQRPVVVTHPKKDLGRGLIAAIRKSAGV